MNRRTVPPRACSKLVEYSVKNDDNSDNESVSSDEDNASNNNDEYEDLSDDSESNNDDAISDNEDFSDAPTRSKRSTRVSTRMRMSDLDGSDNDFSHEPPALPTRRSARSTKFTSNMTEPTDDSFDFYQDEVSPNTMRTSASSRNVRKIVAAAEGGEQFKLDSNSRVSKTRGKQSGGVAKKQKNSGSSESVQSFQETTSKNPTQHKSPAVRHNSKRCRVKTPRAVEESEESSDEESGDDKNKVYDDLKIEHIIASRTESLSVWRDICKSMNTSEIENGSRWFQDDTPNRADDQLEERFLVKWADLSYLHCSWETAKDLGLVEGSQRYLGKFWNKSENGLLFDEDERGDGEYFDPAYVQIERILEIIEPEPTENEGTSGRKKRTQRRRTSSLSKYGIILDKEDPNYEDATGRQLLIKWLSLPYSDSTYEFERDLILNDIEYDEHVQSFLRRSKKPTKKEMEKAVSISGEKRKQLCRIFGNRSSTHGVTDEEKEKSITSYQTRLANCRFANGDSLRDYQAEGVSWLVANHINKRSSILADEMGLGKTIQTAAYVNIVATTLRVRGPFLIIAPLSTIRFWYKVFCTWTKLNTIVYHGSVEDRKNIRMYEMAFEEDRPQKLRFNQTFLDNCHRKNVPLWQKTWMAQVVITTPEMLITGDFAELSAIRWEILVVDEAHRLKNHSSKLASNLRNRKFNFNRTLLLTGTPIQNNMAELWTLLNLIDQKRFGDKDEFLERYENVKSKERIDELHERIRPYILRRLKEDVEKSVPPKEETLIEVELTVLQKQYYRALYEKNLKFLHRNHKKPLDGPSLNNLALQLRKCCNHPFLLRGVEKELRTKEEIQSANKLEEGDVLVKASGKLVLLDKLLPRLKQNGHRVLIFSQFVIMLDILEDYLVAREMKYERIDGSITGRRRQMAIDRFQEEKSDVNDVPFVMLLSTRAGGLGINLTAADTCIIFDSDWNPQNDLQAQARCHRIGQTKEVKIYRLISRKSYEMQMFHMSSLKLGLDQAVLHGIENSRPMGSEGGMTKEQVERLLRCGAYDIFSEEKSGLSEAESNSFAQQDIDTILARRSKTIVHENTGSQSNAAGGAFSKASFKGTPGTGKGGEEDVDIDDPEFWKKVVGDVPVDVEETETAGKKRKRTVANYDESNYDKNLDDILSSSGEEADGSDLSFSSAEIDSDDDDDDDTDNALTDGDGRDVEGIEISAIVKAPISRILSKTDLPSRSEESGSEKNATNKNGVKKNRTLAATATENQNLASNNGEDRRLSTPSMPSTEKNDDGNADTNNNGDTSAGSNEDLAIKSDENGVLSSSTSSIQVVASDTSKKSSKSSAESDRGGNSNSDEEQMESSLHSVTSGLQVAASNENSELSSSAAENESDDGNSDINDDDGQS